MALFRLNYCGANMDIIIRENWCNLKARKYFILVNSKLDFEFTRISIFVK